MDAERWERMQSLFLAAAELPSAAREAHLRAEAGGDGALVDEVLALLAEDERAGSPLDEDVARVAGDLLETARDPLPAFDFGPYHALRVLGEGGMGIVYLAERTDLGSLAAVKILRDAWLSPARRERFVTEQRTLAQLTHASIAQLHDAGTLADGTPWFAMEYVEGVPLTEYCRARDTSIEGRLELFRTVCEAVQYAHAHAVIHRDLKPSNILVTADGTVKLLDFGIAKHLEDLDPAVDQTLTGLRLMTPAYAAPEQLRGARVGIHSDVYSLGVILYELLAQRLPYDVAHLTPAEAVELVLAREPERPSTHARSLVRGRAPGRPAWADLDVLCLAALRENPERRYRTVDALLRDIDRALADEPLEARPDTFGYRLRKFVRRHRTPVVVASVALAAVLALSIVYTVRLAAARNVARDEAARTARIQHFMLSLFEGGDEAAGPAEDLRVLTLLDRGTQEANALAETPLVQAELFRTLGTLYQKLGAFERAGELLTKALDAQRALLGDAHADVAETRVLVGLLRTDEARYDDGEREIRGGLATLRLARGAAHPSVARATAALGRVLEARGRYDEAIRASEEAVALFARDGGEGSAEHTAALGQLADAHYYAGHYAVADELNQRVLSATRRVHGERHPRVADVLINLGASLGDRGKYAEAEAFYRDALAILEEFHGADHFRTASAKTVLGRALVYQKRFDAGVRLLTDALAIQERVHGRVHPRVASALNDLGSAALQQNAFDEAEAHFTRMGEIYAVVYADEHYLQGIATSNLASVMTARGDDVRAEALYRAAIANFERTLGADHLNTGIGRIKLGRALLRQERYAEAELETRAGHDIVHAQASPSVSWLREAREDLAAEYEALGDAERAATFRGAASDGG